MLAYALRKLLLAVPLVVLAALSVAGAWLFGLPDFWGEVFFDLERSNSLHWFLAPAIAEGNRPVEGRGLISTLALAATIGGGAVGFYLYHRQITVWRWLRLGFVPVQRFLLELGVGFAFVGRQHRLDVEDESYYLDLLFYHLKLRCFVVIDLKMNDLRVEELPGVVRSVSVSEGKRFYEIEYDRDRRSRANTLHCLRHIDTHIRHQLKQAV